MLSTLPGIMLRDPLPLIVVGWKQADRMPPAKRDADFSIVSNPQAVLVMTGIIPHSLKPCEDSSHVHQILAAPKYGCNTLGKLIPSASWLFSNKAASMRGKAIELPFRE